MIEPPLTIPFLPDVQIGGALPTEPVRVAAWTATTSAGPSRRLALAGADNTVWICTSRVGAPSLLVPPDISLPGAALNPNASRNVSSSSAGTAVSGLHGREGRPRTLSTTSSVLTTASLRRVLSPEGTTAAVIPSPHVSAAVASPTDMPTAHRTSASVTERSDLMQQLREQAEMPTDERSSLGLGFSGITRRGISTPQPKEDVSDANGGSRTPNSTTSSHESSGRNITSKIAGFLSRSAGEEDCAAREAQAKLEETEVEREMARNAAEDAREAEENRAIKKAEPRAPATDDGHTTPSAEDESDPPVRIVLPEPGRGTIVDVAVLEEVNELVVLRDVGLLDVITLSTLQLTTHVSLDHASPPTATGEASRTPQLAPSWLWRRVHLAAREEGAVLVANGVPWPSPWPSPNGEVTRVAMLAIPSHACVANLELPGVGDIGVTSSGEASFLLHTTTTSVMSYRVVFPSTPPHSRAATPQPNSAPTSKHTSPHLKPQAAHRTGALANVRSPRLKPPEAHQSGLAKFLATRRMGRKPDVVEKATPAGVDQGVEVQRDGGGHWKSIRLHDNGQGVGLGDDHVEAFEFDGKKLHVCGSLSVPEGAPKDVIFTSGWQDVCIAADNGTLAVYGRTSQQGPDSWKLRKSLTAQVACLGGGVLHTVEDKAVTNVDLGSLQRRVEAKLQAVPAGDHLCPSGVDCLFVADEQGTVTKQTPSEYLHGAPAKDGSPSDTGAAVTYSTTLPSEYAYGGRFLVAGDEDGVVRVWDARTLLLRGAFALFDDSVRSATLLDMEEAGTLRGTLLCTSMRGSVSVVSLRGMEQMFLIPAARAPLTRIYIGGKDILLAYEIQKARVWNIETGEFRRSTGLDSADDMLNAPGWVEVRFQAAPPLDSPVSKVVGPVPLGSDLGRLLQLDLRELGKWLAASTGDSRLPALRGLLSVFLTFGINQGIDEVCTVNLGITPPSRPLAVGWEGPHATATVAYTTPAGAWNVSPMTTCLRQLAIVSLLRPFLDSPEHEQSAADVIAFYSASLPEDALEADIGLFAAYYIDSAFDVHQAARMLFNARLSRMPNEEVQKLVAEWSEKLPINLPLDAQLSDEGARALTMVGGMSLHRFECMSPSALKGVAESIDIYLNDPNHTHVDLAIELCAKGFSTWQTYVDPMNLLRRLFFLATHKEIGANLAAQSRLAVLQVASSNAPLFMSTLSMDILDARTLEGRMSIMRLCVFMARKRPALLENGLPRIAEAVVKSLDPNIGKMRDDVWEAATVILNELVEAFTTIAFHAGTQKLAVGTNEGAVIMYELKTASRLYVLEPHRHPVSAVSFSPDGRRLVTVSLLEGDSTVWKVGSSLSGFFNVGGPPRQGGKPGEPYRRFPIFRAGSTPMGDTGALSDVRISWPAPRTACITIKETALNYETT